MLSNITFKIIKKGDIIHHHVIVMLSNITFNIIFAVFDLSLLIQLFVIFIFAFLLPGLCNVLLRNSRKYVNTFSIF